MKRFLLIVLVIICGWPWPLRAEEPGSTSTNRPPLDLPLVEVPAHEPAGVTLAVMISGDGGWAAIDHVIAGILSGNGIPVVGFNSLKYFWKKRTPEESAHDLELIITHYLAAWDKSQVILIGYSRGADVLPFMANRLPPEILNCVALIALLGPGENIDFKFHLTEWLLDPSGKHALPVLPEVEKLRGKKILCFCGKEESDPLCEKMDSTLAKTVLLPGAHHFGGHYRIIAEEILNGLKSHNGSLTFSLFTRLPHTECRTGEHPNIE